MRCKRCYNEMRVHTVSIFNTQEICMDCAKKEKAHPEYENARKRELEEVRKGNYNFEGIGKPVDL